MTNAVVAAKLNSCEIRQSWPPTKWPSFCHLLGTSSSEYIQSHVKTRWVVTNGSIAFPIWMIYLPKKISVYTPETEVKVWHEVIYDVWITKLFQIHQVIDYKKKSAPAFYIPKLWYFRGFLYFLWTFPLNNSNKWNCAELLPNEKIPKIDFMNFLKRIRLLGYSCW